MPMPKMGGDMKMKETPKESLTAQKWDGKTFTKETVESEPAEIDVVYDALLANRRTIDDPEILAVKPGETVLLRIIAASSATNYYLDTGRLEGRNPRRGRQGRKAAQGNFSSWPSPSASTCG